ncbi:mitochondrial ribonuclease P catalytic subunit [Tribolium castaneum]|uniref:mitochondrial ribonuclease P catalytic subunit n=1 Tax=Tribolium castaneum TaxID=7070 RepID=UPI00046C1623|nr:PREDICTED: mitochondrial ribonuclease P protein 3 [Tribolium castaneum]|eukprot:XP_008192100.1 PREDICTED: mitochondrial ribonuclease P protein 3 [Tribolium castaneum]
MFRRLYLTQCVAKRFIQRRPEVVKERQTPHTLLWKTIENTKIGSPQEWKDLRNEILNSVKSITPANIDAVTVNVCTINKKYNLALSYLEFLRSENIELNLATLGNYLKLLYAKGLEEQLSPKDEEKILLLYEKIRKEYPVLDQSTLNSIVQALSLTSQWKQCLGLLDEIKVTGTINAHASCALIRAAFLHNEDALAWKLLNEVIESEKTVHSIVYSTYFKRIGKKSDKIAQIEKMFNFMHDKGLKIESNQIEEFAEALKSHKMLVRSSAINYKGVCKSCNSKLAQFHLTQSEFDEIKQKIIDNVIIGKDVYARTTAQELSKFKNFVSKMPKFDVVIDGLNVAYSAGLKQPAQVTSGLVQSVVAHFVDQGKEVLLLGRSHMNRWPRNNWDYVKENATIFLTENLSQDDPYLLYCALHSGKDTIIVTKDLMRGHKFLLKDVRLKILFDRWLSQRQYQLVFAKEGGDCTFKKPPNYTHLAQKNGPFWHIPCKSENKFVTNKTYWLCVQNNNSGK